MAKSIRVARYIGRRIRKLREGDQARKMSQSYLAKALKLKNANEVSRWESGIYLPKITDLIRLAKFFEVSVVYFLPDDGIGDVETTPRNSRDRVKEAG